MTDVRALLAAERQSRRITHPHLSYTKSGMLVCDVCNLNVKSEALWEGHLKSANHRKNAQASKAAQTQVQTQTQGQDGSGTGKGLKRKIEDVDVDDGQEERHEADTNPDARKKKPKSRLASAATEARDERPPTESVPREDESTGPSNEIEHNDTSAADTSAASATVEVPNGVAVDVGDGVPEKDAAIGAALDPAVDEDEWAAFEREVAPLAAAPAPAPDYSSATISAAPVTAAQLEEQAVQDRRRRLETEADDEKEDEERRLEDEFDVMEEMEERVRKLRQKRDALRNAVPVGADTGQGNNPPSVNSPEETVQDVEHASDQTKDDEKEDDDEDEDDDPDDWYS